MDELGKERIDGGFEVRIVREGVKPLPEHDFPGAFPDGERAAVRLGPEERGSEQDAEIVGIGQAAPVPCDPVQDDGIAVPLDGNVVLPVETQGAAAFVESQFESLYGCGSVVPAPLGGRARGGRFIMPTDRGSTG